MHVFVRKVVCLIACPLLLYPLLSQQVVNAFRSASAPRSQQVSSATQGMAQNPSWRSKIPPPRAAHRTIYAPLLALDDPALAELTLNNNGTQELPIVVTLFTRLGQPIPCSPIVIGPVQVQTLHMSDLVPAMEKNRDQWGGVQISYLGGAMQLGAQITLRGQELPASLDIPFTEMMDFKSDVQDAVWWTPNDGDATLILGNSSDHPIVIDARFSGGESRTVQLLGHGTEVVSTPTTSAHADHATGSVQSVWLSTSGDMASLRAMGYVRSKHTGYISSIRFYDPAVAVGPDLFATNLRTDGTDLHLVLRNTTDVKITATPRLLPPAGEAAGPIALPKVELGAHQNVELDLTALKTQLALKGAVGPLSVQVLSSGAPGELIGALTSFDPSQRLTYDVPLRETGRINKSTGSYPIRLEGDYLTVITITNTGTAPAKFVAKIEYAGGIYVPGTRTLQAGESATFDLRTIVEQKTPDAWGKVLPPIKIGQFHWSIIGGASSSRLIGRAEIASPSKGVSSSYSCQVCCPDNGPFPTMDPTSFTIAAGGSASFTITDTFQNCQSHDYSTPGSIFSWNVSDTNIISVGNGTVTGKAAGSATFTGDEPGIIWLQSIDGTCTENDIDSFVGGSATIADFTLSAAQSIMDGQQSTFNVTVTGGSATAYQWSFTAPSGAGNSPNVNLTAATSAQTNTDGHWFALPNVACPSTANLPNYYNAVYTITASVTFGNSSSPRKSTTLTVNSLWNPAGVTNPNTARIGGIPAMASDGPNGTGTWRVTGKGTLSRVVPTSSTINVIATSQFYNKTVQHEQTHVNNWIVGAGHLYGDLYNPDDFYNQIVGITGTSQSDLIANLTAALTTYVNAQGVLVAQRHNQDEHLAYAVSDPIAPQYVYQNCGRF